jgi:hypothetical protein
LSQLASGKKAETTKSRQTQDFIDVDYGSDSHAVNCIQSLSYFRRFTTCCVCRVLSMRSASSTPLK